MVSESLFLDRFVWVRLKEMTSFWVKIEFNQQLIKSTFDQLNFWSTRLSINLLPTSVLILLSDFFHFWRWRRNFFFRQGVDVSTIENVAITSLQRKGVKKDIEKNVLTHLCRKKVSGCVYYWRLRKTLIKDMVTKARTKS